MKTKYRFIGRSADGRTYLWAAVGPVLPQDTFIEQSVAFFWNPDLKDDF